MQRYSFIIQIFASLTTPMLQKKSFLLIAKLIAEFAGIYFKFSEKFLKRIFGTSQPDFIACLNLCAGKYC